MRLAPLLLYIEYICVHIHHTLHLHMHALVHALVHTLQVVEWLLKCTNHLPSDAECQKCLLAPAPDDMDEADRSDLLHNRTKCLELIMRVCVCLSVCVCVCVSI